MPAVAGELLEDKMRFLALATSLLFSLILGLQMATPAHAQSCQFTLGFAALHDLIPGVVGQCLENETHNPANGDGLQLTANGLLVWRKVDNWTAFTNGWWTWVNGPFGLQQRLNTDRFSWEQNPSGLNIVPPPVAGERCHTAALSLGVLGTDAGAGNIVGTFAFTNNTAVSCTFYGFPGAQRLDDHNDSVQTNLVRGGGFLTNEPGPALITVPPGGTAIFRIHWGQVEVGNEVSCPVSSQLAVTPPDEFDSVVVPIQIRACGGGRLNISAVRPPT